VVVCDVKLKRSDIHPVIYWGWNCPNCECWNESEKDPDCIDVFDSDYYLCDGCFDEFKLDKEINDG